MPVAAAREPRTGLILRPGLPASFKREGTVYAIAFDMDTEQLRVHYGDPYNAAYLEVRRVLERHGFQWQQGSVYFGSPAVTAATVMVAVIDLSTQLPWFAAAVRDIRMLRIEEPERPPTGGAAGGRTDGRGVSAQECPSPLETVMRYATTCTAWETATEYTVTQAAFLNNHLSVDWVDEVGGGHLDTDSADGVTFRGNYGYSTPDPFRHYEFSLSRTGRGRTHLSRSLVEHPERSGRRLGAPSLPAAVRQRRGRLHRRA